MRHFNRIIGSRPSRFAIAGVFNTLVNFLILNLAFYVLHLDKLVSVFVSTSCAISVSFLLNRSFVFMDKTRPLKRALVFSAVTLFGVLLIQTSVYSFCTFLLHNREMVIQGVVHAVSGLNLTTDFVNINASNAIASLCVMFWNYNCYRLFVFSDSRYEHGDEAGEEIATT